MVVRPPKRLVGQFGELSCLRLRLGGIVSAVNAQFLMELMGRLDRLSFELFQTKAIVGVDTLDLVKELNPFCL